MLEVNGYKGTPPRIFWGGMRMGEATNLSRVLAQNATAGLTPTKIGMKTLNEKFGIEFELNDDLIKGKMGGMDNAQAGDNKKRAKF